MNCSDEFWSLLDHLVCTSLIKIDRPKNSEHPKWDGCIYPVDYGYLKNTSSMDQDGIDVWVGSDTSKCVDAVIVVVDIMKRDSEIKILIGCTNEEKNAISAFHNSFKGMKGLLINR